MRLLLLNCSGIPKPALEDRRVPSCWSLLSALRWANPKKDHRDPLQAAPVNAQENRDPTHFQSATGDTRLVGLSLY